MDKITVNAMLSFNLTQEDVDNIMVAALEGGICYWCCYAKVVGEYLGKYASDQISRGGSLILYDAETDNKWELTLDKLIEGIRMYVENGGSSIVLDNGIDDDKIDADVADSIVQYALFGELVFC